MAHCIRHYEEPVAGRCRTCGQVFCSRCLVFAFGPKQPPYCVGCALTASGVRVGRPGGPMAAEGDMVPILDKRVERAQRRAERTAAKAAAKDARLRRKAGQPDGDTIGEVRPSYVPAPSTMTTKTAQQVVMAEVAAEIAAMHEQQEQQTS